MSAPRAIVDTGFVTLHSPFTVGASFLALECAVVVCGVLALRHALAELRRGDGVPMFTWAVSFTYGLMMEIGSYNFLDSFAHGQFTVMFYRKQLPLYVVTLYPVLQYTSIIAARRLGLPRIAQGFAAGLMIVAMDFPFDILGPVEGWWSWSNTDPNMAYRWHGVPVTSYYWHLAWGGILGVLTHVLGRFGDARRPARTALLALPVAMLTILLGLISFAPFHLLKSLGVADGHIVLGLFALSLGVTLSTFRGGAVLQAEDHDKRLFAIPALYFGAHLVIAVAALFAGGAAFGGRMAVIAGVTLSALVAHGIAHGVISRPPSTTPSPGPRERGGLA